MRTILPQAGYSQDKILSITPRSSKNTIIQGSLYQKIGSTSPLKPPLALPQENPVLLI